MIEVTGDLWEYNRAREYGYYCCITTNGTVKKDGSAVMGRGCAAQAKHRYPGIDRTLGRDLQGNGIRCVFLQSGIIVFPVKFQWFQRADLRLIEDSCIELDSIVVPKLQAAHERNSSYAPIIILPRPGCGNGGRDWETEVKPILRSHLQHNRYVIISKPEVVDGRRVPSPVVAPIRLP